MRQYLTEGWYPSGQPSPNDGYNPSAAVLKAMILNSGQHLEGVVDVTTKGMFRAIPAPPSFYQGYGLVRLNQILRLSTSDPKSLYVSPPVDPIVSSGPGNSICLTVPPNGEVKATLVWTDPSGNPASWHTLVNDLDLFLIEEGTSATIYGNPELYGRDGVGYPDSINNNEQLVYKNTGPTVAQVSLVVAVAVLSPGYTNQSYGLVAYGDFTVDSTRRCASQACPATPAALAATAGSDPATLAPWVVCNNKPCQHGVCDCGAADDDTHLGSAACAPTCPNNCSGVGECVGDKGAKRCVCDDGRFGHDCSKGACSGEVKITASTGSSRPCLTLIESQQAQVTAAA